MFDKHTDNIFQTNVRNIASQRSYYELEIDGEKVSLEENLTALEDTVASILDRVIREGSIANLVVSDRQWIALFAAVQFIRVEQFRVIARDLNKIQAEKITSMGGDPGEMQNFKRMNENDVKAFTVSFIPKGTELFSRLLLAKLWFLVPATHNDPFYISDNPVVRQNEQDHGPYGNLGFASQGIEIYLPVSSTLSLGMVDPVIFAPAGQAYENQKRLHAQLLTRRATTDGANYAEIDAALKAGEAEIQRMEKYRNALQNGSPVPYSAEVVIRLNSLQVSHAARFVMSCKCDFSLAQRMIRDNDGYRRGLSVTV